MYDKTKLNVYDLAGRRLKKIFSEFDNIYVSFSGGKDSGVMLNLCIDYIRSNNLNTKIGVFHMDYEVQYEKTTEYVQRVMQSNPDILEIYHICVPFKVSTCTSMSQTYWRPWDPEQQDIWVRKMPENCYTARDFDFLTPEMWDYNFQVEFARWLHQKKQAKRTCCLVGIRTQESLNRWRTIHSSRPCYHFKNLKWTNIVSENVYNAYFIYDWLTTDVWTAYGRYNWDYNKLYDLYYMAGVTLERQRVASPFISSARESLHLYRAIDPDMWGKMLCRVNGVHFAGLYAKTKAMGRSVPAPPPGHTWESYMHFLLSTLPPGIRNNYLKKLKVSIDFWRRKGGCLAHETIEKLRHAGVAIEVMDHSNYRTQKKPVRMEYIDEINIPEAKEIPTFKRVCLCILKNDHACKYMGFSLTKEDKARTEKIMEQYREIFM